MHCTFPLNCVKKTKMLNNLVSLLHRLQTLGQLTRREVEALLDSGLPPSQYAYVLLEWTGLHIMNGLEAGVSGCSSQIIIDPKNF